MRLKHLLTGIAASVIAIGSFLEVATADLKFPMLVYRTGAYAPNGIPNADGFVDYYRMINARDGGIGGEKIVFPECETGYKTQVGVECYEKHKKCAMVFQPMSTAITYQLIPKATADDIPIHSMGYGRTSAADGNTFSHVFTIYLYIYIFI